MATRKRAQLAGGMTTDKVPFGPGFSFGSVSRNSGALFPMTSIYVTTIP
jgi:hypothetical protein